MLEREIQRAILDYLAYKRIFHWRNNSGTIFSEHKGRNRMIRLGTPGSPDIFALVRGKLIGLEVKTDKGKQTPLQAEFGAKMEANGGLYNVVRSIDDVEDLLASLK